MFIIIILSVSFQHENIRENLYMDLDWYEFDKDTKGMVYLMLVGCTPDCRIKIGSVYALSMTSFTTVRILKRLMERTYLSFFSSSSKCVSPSALFSRQCRDTLRNLKVNV